MVLERIGSNDDTQKQAPAMASLDGFLGADHPLFKPLDLDTVNGHAASDSSFNPNSVTEVVTDMFGLKRDVPLPPGPLSAGDHTLQFENGRQFVVHVPPDAGNAQLPVMFVIAPSVHTNQGYDAKNFETETGMNKYADQDKFVAVYALPKKHLLGVDSREPAEAWNAPGSGIDDTDLKRAGYNDEEYIKSIVGLMPRLANVDSSHRNWGAIGFSQGSIFLNQLSHDMPNLFPSIGLVGSSVELGRDYSTAAGNAKNVMLVNMHGDRDTLPFPGEESFEYKAQIALVSTLNYLSSLWAKGKSALGGTAESNAAGSPPEGWGTALAEKLDPLGAIDNRDQNPVLQEHLYKHDIESQGPFTVERSEFTTPIAAAQKDRETLILSDNNPDRLAIYDLATAMHSWPGPDHNSHVNSTHQYTEFNTSEAFAAQFEAFNEAEKDE